MKNIAEIRRRHKINGESISSLAEEFKHSRNTIRKHLETVEEPVYQRQQQLQPKLGKFETQLLSWLEQDARLPRKQRRTAQRLFECLQVEGYTAAIQSILKNQHAGNLPLLLRAHAILSCMARVCGVSIIKWV